MRLNELEEFGKPYAIFRMPNSSEIQLYVQDDFSLNTTTDFNEKGFVLSPFSSGEQVYIAADTIYSFPVEEHFLSDSLSEVALPESISEKQKFVQHVNQAKKEIAGGVFEKVVLSRPIFIESNKSAIATFNALVSLYPNAFVYCWYHPKIGLWLGATPERFVSLDKGHLKTMSLAGTLPYIKTPPKWSSKEIHEQALVTESILSDLTHAFPGVLPKVGSTENLRAGGVYHLRTLITLSDTEITLKKAVNVLHPTPAVGGLPKQPAVDFIIETEGYNREYYTGFLGPFSKGKNADLFVNLRCAKKTEMGFTVYVGAGITAESDPEKEYHETQRKAQTLGKSLLF